MSQDTTSQPHIELMRRLSAAYRSISAVRVAILVVCTTAYFFAYPVGVYNWPAYIILTLGWAYSLYFVLRPLRHYNRLQRPALSYILDALFIVAWVWVTGSGASPYFILWYVAICAVAYRQGLGSTLLIAFLYALCYLVLMLVTEQLAKDAAVPLLRCSFIFIIGYLAQRITHSTYLQAGNPQLAQEMMDKLEQAETKLTETAATLAQTQQQLNQLTEHFDAIIAERTRDITEESRLYRRLLDHLPIPAWAVSTDGKVIYTNKALQAGSAAELQPSTSVEALLPVEEPARIQALWLQAQVDNSPFEAELRWLKPDGTDAWMQCNMAPVINDTGSIIAWIGMAVDIDRRQQLIARHGTHTGIIAHEVRLALTGVNDYLQLAQKSLAEEEVEGATIFVHRAAGHMAALEHLLGQITDVAKVQSKRMTLHLSEFEINQLATEIIDGSYNNKPVHFVKDSALYIQGDKERLAQVLVAIIDAAIVYTLPGKQVKLIIEHRKEMLHIDAGGKFTEIPEVVADKMFDAFQKPPDGKGLGVNLYIAKGIVALHNGKLWVQQQNNGSSICISIRVRQLTTTASERL